MASRLLTVAQLLGAARACNAIAKDYAGVRAQFGHLIQNYQAVQHSLVDVFGALEAAELLVNWALTELGRGAPLDAPMIASAVSFGRESMWNATIKSYDIMGGVGFMEEHPLSELSRGVLPLMAALGSAESNFEAVAETVRKEALL